MNNFDLIGALSTYAAANSMVFLSGANFYQNYEASQAEYELGQLVLTAEFDASVQFSRGFTVGSITYSGIMALGRKFEDDADTHSNLDETFHQKYDRRLYDLMSLMVTQIASFACANELEVTQCQFKMDLNKFNTNIDFVAAQITFVQ
jgi:hypothetical protein